MIRRQVYLLQGLLSTLLIRKNYSNLSPKIVQQLSIQQYDLAVIGGGSGGLSAAFEASKYGLSVIVIDYVQPSPQGTKWGLGGTCVNVGCIPKKLMHQASKYSQDIINSQDYGWAFPTNLTNIQLRKQFKWQKLILSITSYIKSLNFGYLSTINKLNNVSYLNSMATFVDNHTLLCSKDINFIRNYVEKSEKLQNIPHQLIRAKNIIIATGTRPSILPIQGSNLAITSDDIFFKKKPPGKTLVVGGGYVAVQIAGILNGLGYPVSIMTRGDYLRQFDRDMVQQIINDLSKRQIQIIKTSLPKSMKKINNQQIQVIIQNQINLQQSIQAYNTVIFAVGRKPTTYLLNLQKIGIKINQNLKIITQDNQIQKTNVDNIYAIGDVVAGVPELTSTVMKVGAALGRRLAEKMGKAIFSKHQTQISLQNYPTTIFTPLQYSTCGLSQQKAIKQYSSDKIEVYHIKFVPLEENLLQKYDDQGSSNHSMVYMKAIVHIPDGKVLGLHYTGPNAGQIMQGLAMAIRVGITKDQLDTTIGIHPTIAESFTDLHITKSSGQDYIKTSC